MSNTKITMTESELKEFIKDVVSKAISGKGFDPIDQETGFGFTPTGDVKTYPDIKQIDKLPNTLTGKVVVSTSESDYFKKVMELLKAYEGFKSEAYQDAKGIWTIGYGSTYVDGKKVKKGDKITQGKALQQKKDDILRFKNIIIGQIGQKTWNGFDLDTKAVLTSIAYNYGRLPDKIINSVKSGDKKRMHPFLIDKKRMASAIRDLSSHNKGINRWRREDEAMVLQTGKSNRAPNYDDVA